MLGFLRRKPQVAIESLRMEHSFACAQLHAAYFAHPWSVVEFEAMIAGSGHCCDGALEEPSGRLVGFLISRQTLDEAEILTIAVEKSHRRFGIGGQLLASQMETLRRRRTRKLFLEVDEGNFAARRLYENFGFGQVGVRPGYYRSASGQAANALLLACDLT